MVASWSMDTMVIDKPCNDFVAMGVSATPGYRLN